MTTTVSPVFESARSIVAQVGGWLPGLSQVAQSSQKGVRSATPSCCARVRS